MTATTETGKFFKILADSAMVGKLQEITGYPPWFIKEQLDIPLVDQSHISEQQIKEAIDMLGRKIDDATNELCLSALMIAVKTATEPALWNLYYEADYYSKAKYEIFRKLLTFANTFKQSFRILMKLCDDDIISVEGEEILNETLSLCASQASLEQSSLITSAFRRTRLTKESAAQAQVIAEAQLKHLTCVDDYKQLRAVDNFGGMTNWVAAQMLLIKLKALIETPST